MRKRHIKKTYGKKEERKKKKKKKRKEEKEKKKRERQNNTEKTREFKFTALELLFLYILFYLNLLYFPKV